jgi:hypothetical protein
MAHIWLYVVDAKTDFVQVSPEIKEVYRNF